ncbi:A24 family peptidase [Desulfuromonas carbonis]|uniref:prepilin peptidase n=1 Tax=Desulfuromonas sp. DDH964 TaxID=1823759 RepID=UPI00078DF19D|nr:A24 family peptidase [Desulfuromonas sp. DDH964]AMV71815.1 type IV prepilin-like proteins leader peptide processing enzyme [Desulfuromonas sp. DDH964]
MNFSIFLGAAFVVGAVIGSFLNVCIYRIPAGESIVRPRSRCGSCGNSIKWYQNLPILSYLVLRGHCAMCNAKISWRYPLVEWLTGGLFSCLVFRFGPQPFVVALMILVAILVTITFIDIDHQIIPDVISLPGILVGFFASFFLPWVTWGDSLLGILAGGGSLYLVAAGYALLTGKEGMGGGDIKLLALIGAFLGWKAILPIIFFSSVLGTLVGVPLMWIKRSDGQLAIPFGPFLAAGSLTYLFWGPMIVRWYLALF